MPSLSEFEDFNDENTGTLETKVMSVTTTSDPDFTAYHMEQLAPYTVEGYEWRPIQLLIGGEYIETQGGWWPYCYYRYLAQHSDNWERLEDGGVCTYRFKVTQDGKDYTECKLVKLVSGSVAATASFSSLSELPLYVYDGTKCLELGRDYTLSDYGVGKVSVSGKENYTGSVTAKFTVLDADADKLINRENVKDIAPITYTGKAIKPEPTVTVGQNTLAKNKDYTVSYEDNLHAGIAVITVTGKGNYKGMKAQATFVINPQKMSKASVKGTRNNLIVIYNKKSLRQGIHFETPSYDESTLKKNKIKVTLTGKGDFTGTVTKTVKVQ